MHNEEGCFRRLGFELEQIAREYGRELDEINQVFLEVNGCKQQLRRVLEGNSYNKWDMLQDLALQSGIADQIQYLITVKG